VIEVEIEANRLYQHGASLQNQHLVAVIVVAVIHLR
jgi:hypothetical protein